MIVKEVCGDIYWFHENEKFINNEMTCQIVAI